MTRERKTSQIMARQSLMMMTSGPGRRSLLQLGSPIPSEYLVLSMTITGVLITRHGLSTLQLSAIYVNSVIRGDICTLLLLK
jgi:hypothetical protein